MARTKVSQRVGPRFRARRCQQKGCGDSGYGGWCTKHTPTRGAGVVCCFICGLPVAHHPVGQSCHR